MDAVELQLPAAVVSKHMRSSGGGGGGGGGTRVEMMTSQLESGNCSSSFHPPKGNSCNLNGSKPAFWNKIANNDHYKQDIKQHKSGKSGNSRRSCVTGSPKELESYAGKCNISEKTQRGKQKSVSVKQSEKRNGKIRKNKCDSFSVLAGLSTFSSAADGNNIFGAYESKNDIYDVTKHLDELALSQLLDGSYKRPHFTEKNTKVFNKNILQRVKDACSVLQLQKSTQPQNLAVLDSKLNEDTLDPSCNKVKDCCSNHPNMYEFPLLAPRGIMDQLSLSPHKNLDLLLLDTMKPTSLSKLNHGRVTLPSFPWSGTHSKTNPDVVKSTPHKSQCQGQWVKIQNSITSFGDGSNFIADLGSLVYDQSLVPLKSQHPGLTQKETSPDGVAPGIIAAAETLCEIASKKEQTWPKKHSLKATKLKSDEKVTNIVIKRPFSTVNSARVSSKRAKLRKLVPMKWNMYDFI